MGTKVADLLAKYTSQAQLEEYAAKNGYKEFVEDFTSHLADNAISPDSFEGNDLEKIQAAINECSKTDDENQLIESKRVIKFSRIYDITGLGELLIPPYDTRTLYLIGVGGGIKKTDAGKVFTSSTQGHRCIWSQKMIYESVAGEGTIIWDAARLKLITSLADNYHQVDCGFDATGTYMQSVRMAFCNVQRGNGYFITARYTMDCSFTNNIIENRESFFRNLNDGLHTFIYENQNLRITDNVIEAITSTNSVMLLGASWAVDISGNYFEGNNGVCIDMTANDAAVGHLGLTISKNNIQQTAAQITDHTPGIKWGKCVEDVVSFGNVSSGLLHDIGNDSTGLIASIGDRSYTNELITTGQESKIFEIAKIKKRPSTWTPTLTWGTSDPTSPTVRAKYKTIGYKCKFDLDITSTDGNGATSLTVTVPITAYADGVTHTLSAIQKVGTTWTVIPAYFDQSNNLIQIKINTATDGQSLFVSVSGEYEVAQ
jgi:hypothetical protein